MDNHQSSRPPVTGYPAPGYPPSNNPSGCATTAGTGFPYAAPPLRPAHYNPRYPYYPRATLFRRLLAILIAFFIISGTIVFIIWLVLRPRFPDFRVDSLSLSNFNLSSSPSSLISAKWDVRFTVRNPNHKLSIFYDHINAYVFYKSESLSDTTLPPFVQGTRNQTTLRASFATASSYVDDWAVEGINGERKSHGTVNFNVRLLSRVRFKASWWRARHRILSVYCGDLTVGISSNGAGGTLVGGARECRVGI